MMLLAVLTVVMVMIVRSVRAVKGFEVVVGGWSALEIEGGDH